MTFFLELDNYVECIKYKGALKTLSTQPTITCSKLSIETLELSAKFVQSKQ